MKNKRGYFWIKIHHFNNYFTRLNSFTKQLYKHSLYKCVGSEFDLNADSIYRATCINYRQFLNWKNGLGWSYYGESYLLFHVKFIRFTTSTPNPFPQIKSIYVWLMYRFLIVEYYISSFFFVKFKTTGSLLFFIIPIIEYLLKN